MNSFAPAGSGLAPIVCALPPAPLTTASTTIAVSVWQAIAILRSAALDLLFDVLGHRLAGALFAPRRVPLLDGIGEHDLPAFQIDDLHARRLVRAVVAHEQHLCPPGL